MRDHLTFILAGPFASFGGPAGNTRRPSEALPARSAIIGLLGAALGIERDDRRRQAALGRYEVALTALRRSSPLRDFHTAHTVPGEVDGRPDSRRDELRRGEFSRHTIVSRRDYRCDVAIAVAVWGGGDWKLTELAAALHRPVYALSLGRRSCPPAFPLGPRIVMASDPVAALRTVRPAISAGEPGGWQADHGGKVLCWSEIPGASPEGEAEAHTCPDDRNAWTFRPEPVWTYRQPAAGEDPASCS